MFKELKTAPAVDPITLAQVKVFSFGNTTKLDSVTTENIKAAVSWAEEWTGRAFVNQDWYIYYDLPEFKNVMDLSTLNVTAINEVVYYTKTNTETAIASSNYRLHNDRIYFNDNYNPVSTSIRNFQAVRIDVSAGYGADSDNMNKDIQSGLAQIISHWARTGKGSFKDLEDVPKAALEKLKKYKKRIHWL